MKIFISGPMNHKPNGNKEEFFKAEYKLKRLGHSVFNPAWCRYEFDTEFTADDMHMIDFSALSRCDAIYMLKGWQYSKGAKAEYEHAKELGKAILREGDPITDPLKYGKYDWESWKNKLPDSLNNSNHTRVAKPLNDCFSIYDYIGPNKVSSLEKQYNDLAEDMEDCKKEIDLLWNNAFTGLEKRVDLFWKIREDNEKEFKKDIDDIHNWINAHDRMLKAQSSQMSYLSSELDDYIDDYKEADDALEKRIKDMNERMNLFGRELDAYEEAYKQLRTSLDNNDNALERRIKALEKKYDELNHAVGIQGKEIGGIIQRRCDDNQIVNNMLNDINIRLKAIEKRLSIKPFYEPTEDEKDDD